MSPDMALGGRAEPPRLVCFGACRDARLFERKSSPVSQIGEHLFDDPIFSEGAGTLI
jgi:hypothetical protein